MAQQIVRRGSVVLIRYPFTDLTGVKVRPSSNCAYTSTEYGVGARQVF
jgi:hypothetical protein